MIDRGGRVAICTLRGAHIEAGRPYPCFDEFEYLLKPILATNIVSLAAVRGESLTKF